MSRDRLEMNVQSKNGKQYIVGVGKDPQCQVVWEATEEGAEVRAVVINGQKHVVGPPQTVVSQFGASRRWTGDGFQLFLGKTRDSKGLSGSLYWFGNQTSGAGLDLDALLGTGGEADDIPI